MSTDILTAFRAAIAERCPPPDEIIADGELHRFYVPGGKPGNRDGAYGLHLDGIAAGWFENWADGKGVQNWCSRQKNDVPDAEWKEHLARMAADRKRREEKLAKERADARVKAREIWAESAECTFHPYLATKNVKPYGLRTTTRAYDLVCSDGEKTVHVPAGTLVVPLCDSDCELHSLEFIWADGKKRFLPSGQKQGHFHVLGDPHASKVICVAEGYATAATIFEATRYATIIAFDCGNLESVAQTFHKEFP